MKNILYLTYDGLTGNLGESQILSYIHGLSNKGMNFFVISFEKEKDFEKKKDKIQTICDDNNITWIPLKYHKSPALLSTIYDIFNGIINSLKIMFKHKINLIHFRSYVPGIIPLFLKIIGFDIKVIFDLRGFWPEERVQIGMCLPTPPKYSILLKSPKDYFKNLIKFFLYKIFKAFEYVYIKYFDAFVVLTNSGMENFKSRFNNLIKNKPCFVIPTVVNTDKIVKIDRTTFIKQNPEFDYLKDKFIVIYSGSIGNRYNLNKMFKTFLQIKKLKSNAHFLFLSKNRDLITNNAKKFNLSENLYSIQYTDLENVFKFYQISDIGIAFYSNTEFTHIPNYLKATSPTKIHEYLICGLKTIFHPKNVGDLNKLSKTQNNLFLFSKNLINNDFLNKTDYKIQYENLYHLTLEYGINRYFELYKRTIDN